MNPMKEIHIEAITVNIGVGKSGEELDKAATVLKQLTNSTPVKTKAKVKQPKWDLRPGLEIGVKTTLRGAKAEEFLTKALIAKENTLSKRNFDKSGNFGFGVSEHIELPGVKYDPKLGIIGFDVVVSLGRKGYRIKRRKYSKRKVGHAHRVTKEEAIQFMKEKFKIEVE